MFGRSARPRLRPVGPVRPSKEALSVSTTTTPANGASQAAPEEPTELVPAEESPTTALVESLLDSLPVWTIVAAAIAFLYLVWATVVILNRYVGPLPSVGP
jgi:hypothetical protein